ncbi:MAG: glycosyltransferase family 2 protein [Pseudomonadota bacterium]
MILTVCIFWLSLSLIAYSYLIYPVVLYLLTRKLEPPTPATATEDAKLPSLSVIIAAYNEEKHIEQRVENLLQQDYGGPLEILVGSDGSSDRTNALLARFADHPQCAIHLFDHNRGKASVLNDLAAAAKGDILVFSDANTRFSPNNIARLIAYFTTDRIGGVCGELQIYDPDAAGSENQDSAYWRYERFLKQRTSYLRCLPGANGANYAIRKALWQPIPADTIVDDFLIGCRVVLQGKELVYAPDAVAREEQAPSTESEVKRRIRIGNGNYQALGWLLGDVLRSSRAFRFVFCSHKVIRWFVPHLLLIAFITNAVLAPGSVVYSLLFIAQLLGYGLCAMVHLSSERQRWPSPALMLYYLVAMNVGLGKGFLRYLAGGSRAAWERTAR